jgi:hypothetical protein
MRIQLTDRLYVFGGIICVCIWLGCGDDEADAPDLRPIDDEDAEKIDVVGVWRLTSFEPHVPGLETLPEQVFTLNADNTWQVVTKLDLPGFGGVVITAEGTYQLTGDKIRGETTKIETTPEFNIPLSIPSGFTGESTVRRDGDQLILTQRDNVTGRTTITVYEQV